MDAEVNDAIYPTPASFDIELKLFLEAIYLKYEYDFRQYAHSSLKRRVTAAMTRFGCATITQLQELVMHDALAFPQLLDFLTVQVSEMFRDPTYFRTVRESVVPVLRTYPSLKVWVAGCSQGEEAYSFAILLREEGLLDRTLIYATDINGTALRSAETGVYDIARLPTFTENHRLSGAKGSLSDYYTAGYGRAVLDSSLRQHIVFSDHSLATDAVFAEVQLISCRNVLIYFDRQLQDRALGLFHEALSHKGFLGLGSKETIRFSALAAQFQPINERERVYRKVGL
ncbi:MAG: protein-glutamate O-methyltransferase CheR [Myxococcales bacterium]|nr:MAG: protein-glutamate O-methyltransferase CheR [Myxococcales bacterium]